MSSATLYSLAQPSESLDPQTPDARKLLGAIDGGKVSGDLLAFPFDAFIAKYRAYARMQKHQKARLNLRRKTGSKDEGRRKVNCVKACRCMLWSSVLKASNGGNYLLE